MLQVIHGDCLDVLPTLGERFAACVTDPPYHLTSGNAAVDWSAFGPNGTKRPNVGPTNANGRGFMGKQWDGGNIAFRPETWRAVFDALLPGAHLVCFGGTRTWHRMACAIEDAGFEIRDTLCWLYGSGFPKSLDVSKAIDKAAGAEREVVALNPNHRAVSGVEYEGVYAGGNTGSASITASATPDAVRWQGWGTALKPAWEPVILARKPLIGTVTANVLAHGTGALNVDACRIETAEDLNGGAYADNGNRGVSPSLHAGSGMNVAGKTVGAEFKQPTGRWPANVLHDGSAEVEAAFAAFGDKGGGFGKRGAGGQNGIYSPIGGTMQEVGFGDTGTAGRFFFSAKASAADRADSKHPTVKPVELMRWLVRLVTPPSGAVLDPFAGSGTTGEAAMLEGFDATLIERDATHAADIAHRIKRWSGEDAPLFAQAAD